MADEYITEAGSMQAVPTVDVIEHDKEAYITEAGSMQSAMPVNVQSGGIPEGDVAVGNGDPVNVRNSSGADPHPATIVVEEEALVGVNLVDATVALVDDGDEIPVRGIDFPVTVAEGAVTGVTIPDTFALVEDGEPVDVVGELATVSSSTEVSAGEVSEVTLPGNAALVVDGAVLTIPVTGDYVDTVSFTVAGGLITGIVLS